MPPVAAERRRRWSGESSIIAPMAAPPACAAHTRVTPVVGTPQVSPRGTRTLTSLEVPAEVDLYLCDLVAIEGEDLGVAEPRSVGPRALVGDEDLVAPRNQAHELEGRDEL